MQYTNLWVELINLKACINIASPWAETGIQMWNSPDLNTMPDSIVKQAVRVIKDSGVSGGGAVYHFRSFPQWTTSCMPTLMCVYVMDIYSEYHGSDTHYTSP